MCICVCVCACCVCACMCVCVCVCACVLCTWVCESVSGKVQSPSISILLHGNVRTYMVFPMQMLRMYQSLSLSALLYYMCIMHS